MFDRTYLIRRDAHKLKDDYTTDTFTYILVRTKWGKLGE